MSTLPANNTEGILIKILCVQFCTHVIWDVKSKIYGRRRTATDRDGSGIRDWNDLEDEQKRGASVLSLFSLSFFSLQHPGQDVWKTGVQRSYWRLNVLWRDKVLKLSAICKRLRLSGITLNQVRRRFCAEDEEDWAEHRALWDSMGKLRNLWYVVISNEWQCSFLSDEKKIRRVQ